LHASDNVQDQHSSLCRRFKFNTRAISLSHKNKLSARFQEIDRRYICKKTKDQRTHMGCEFDDFNLLDVYAKTNTNKIA